MTKPADGGKRLPRRRTIEEKVKETETEGDKEEEYKKDPLGEETRRKREWNMLKNLKIVQINLNHCWGAHNLLQQFMKERGIEVALVTEPIYIPEKNWISSINKGAAISWTPDIKARIKEVVREEEFVAMELENIVMISCYISPREPESFPKC